MFSRYIYVQVFKDRFVVHNAAEPGKQALEAKGTFSHPRLLLGDFDAALACLKPIVEKARGSVFRAPFTYLLIHPMEATDKDLAPVEERAFMELAEQAGAAKVLVWTGPQLSDIEVIEKLKKK